MRLKGVDAYDFLLAQLVELKICPDHLVELQSRCGNCGSHQLTLPTNCKLDICGKCGAWLGAFVAAPLDTDLESAAYQKWLINELVELLMSRDEVAPLLTGREVSKFLRELLAATHLTQKQLATRVNIPVDTLRQWIHSRNKPTIASMLRACANLGVSPASLYLDPQLAAHQLSFPFLSPTIYRCTRDAPRKQHSQELIRNAIALQLSRTELPFLGTKELARNLDIPLSILYFHDPEGCKLLTRRLRRHRSAKREYQKSNLARSAQRVLARMEREGQPLTRRIFVERLMARSKCSIWIAKDLFPVALRKFLSKDGPF